MAVALSHSVLLGDIGSGVSSGVYNPVCPPRVADVGTFSCNGCGVARESSGALDEKSFIAEGRSIMLSSADVQWLKKLPQCLHVMERHMHYSMIT